LLEQSFANFKLKLLSGIIPANIGHIVISESYLENTSIELNCWNEDKKLSDHKGVSATIQFADPPVSSGHE